MSMRDWIEYCQSVNLDPSKVPLQDIEELSPENQSSSEPSPLSPNSAHWDELRAQAMNCTACPLAQTRNNVVFGEGSESASLMFVGEGPGFYEDQQGRPFVGKAGELLDKMIQAMGLKREDTYIANVVKCRPPENRNPEPEEIEKCQPYLNKQIEIIQPEIIVALGTFAAQVVLENDLSIGKLRGKFHESNKFQSRSSSPIKIMATYHPAFLLRNPHMKAAVWEDLQKVMKLLNLNK